MAAPPILRDIDPAFYRREDWSSLRPFLKSRGYRFFTVRDLAHAFASASSEPDDESDPGPAQEDDEFHWLSATGAIFDPAIRLSDSSYVVLKIVDTARSQEARIFAHLKLGDPSIALDPKNKVIPVLEVIELSATRSIVVSERWGSRYNDFTDPTETWEGFAAFVQQALQGLAFLHAHHIAHLDISMNNILEYPPGLLIPPNPPEPPRYAFIDFGLSVMYNPESDPGPYRVTGNVATYKPPELSKTVPYDPFKVDVWQMGEVLSLICKDPDVEMAIPETFHALLSEMKHDVPAERPTAAQALGKFLLIV
ncbi:kinase-like domain-containing protein [Mycena filopes]|nr:kinase-like domain-containing protein [Mycena filopes]